MAKQVIWEKSQWYNVFAQICQDFIILAAIFEYIIWKSVKFDGDDDEDGSSFFLITSKSLSRINNNDRRLLWGFLQTAKSFLLLTCPTSLFCISFFFFIRIEDQRLCFHLRKETFEWTKKTPTKNDEDLTTKTKVKLDYNDQLETDHFCSL